MKKIGDLFSELGFNPEAEDSVKIAFVKNLVKAAYGVDMRNVPSPEKIKQVRKNQEKFEEMLQLSFQFSDDDDFKKAN